MCHGSLRGSALTAAHFCQTATKVSKKALPYHTAASPGLGGALTPALLWAFASSEQSHYKSKSKSNLGQIHVLPPIRPAGRPPRRLLLYRPPGGRTMGKGPFGSFWVLSKGTRCKSETIVSVIRKCRICTRWSSNFKTRPDHRTAPPASRASPLPQLHRA